MGPEVVGWGKVGRERLVLRMMRMGMGVEE